MKRVANLHPRTKPLIVRAAPAWSFMRVVTLTFLLVCAFTAVRADEVFNLHGIAVDATAASSSEARDLAFSTGQREAFLKLLRRLTVENDETLRSVRDSVSLADLIAGFEVDEEKVSPTRYLARLTINFKPDAVRQALRSRGIGYAETVSKPVLVVPVLLDGPTTALWEDGNAWRNAWMQRESARGDLVPLILPLGDIVDLGTLSAEQALLPDEEALMRLAERYGTSEIAVAVAQVSRPAPKAAVQPVEPAESGEPEPAETLAEAEPAAPLPDPGVEGWLLDLTVRRVGLAGSQSAGAMLEGQAGEAVADLMARGSQNIVEVLADSWKMANLLQFDRTNALLVRVPLTSLADWVESRRRLGGMAVIADVQLVELMIDHAFVYLHHLGDPEQLSLALEQVDLALTFEPEGWTLQSTSNLVREP